MNKPKIRFKGFEGEWKDSMLSDFSYSICSGRDTAHKGIYPLYGSTGIIGTTNKPSYNGAMLLVARVGANAGKLQIINEECGVSDNTLIIKPNGNISVSWLYYYLVHCNLNHLVYGSGQPLITGYMLKRIPILLGSKKECDEIASYFTSLDAQIAASTSRLSSLKQIKAASLLNMFPQKGEMVPRVRFKGFQGEWKEIKLGEIFSVEIGEFVIKTKQKNNAPYPVYNGGVSNTGFYDCYNQEGPKIIVSARGANAGYVNYCTTDFWAGNSCYSIGAKNNDELKFFFYFLKRFQDIYMKNQYSASIPSISK
ncbi:MAG: restriction endonuclease subunit S [Prevotella sp.]|nr:restriction endonuclease subunit S [Prevotella sp.]